MKIQIQEYHAIMQALLLVGKCIMHVLHPRISCSRKKGLSKDMYHFSITATGLTNSMLRYWTNDYLDQKKDIPDYQNSSLYKKWNTKRAKIYKERYIAKYKPTRKHMYHHTKPVKGCSYHLPEPNQLTNIHWADYQLSYIYKFQCHRRKVDQYNRTIAQ